MTIRFDTIKFPKVEKTKDGYLRGAAFVTRAGVFTYANKDGSVRKELRHPDDVFKTDSLESLKMIPITKNHPPVLVNAENISEYAAGYTGETYAVVDNKIQVNLTVTHHDLIDEILKGTIPEISMGYTVDLVKEQGVYDGEQYDYRQTNIKYNHVAGVPRGRAGREARFRFDNACESINNQPNENGERKMDDADQKMAELKLDSLNSQLKEKHIKIDLLQTELEQEKLKTDALEKANQNLKDEIETLKLRADAKAISEQVINRVNLLAAASTVIDPTAFLYHSDRDIMISAINTKMKSNDRFDNVEDEYLKGKFDALFSTNVSANTKINKNVFNVISHHVDSAHFGSIQDDVMSSMIKNQRNKGIL